MTTLLEVRTAEGKSRRCNATCHHAKGEDCCCVCGGELHGREPDSVDWEELNELRVKVALDHGDSVQLRLGA